MERLRQDNVRNLQRSVQRVVIVAERQIHDRVWLANTLTEAGYFIQSVGTQCDLHAALARDPSATLILDVDFHPNGSLATLGLLQLDGACPQHIVLLAERITSELTGRSTQMGVRSLLKRSADRAELRKAVLAALNRRPEQSLQWNPIIGNSPAVHELRSAIQNIAATDAAVMILGESGTGKELVAQAIHNCSRRAALEFIPINMAALPEDPFESRLFADATPDNRQLDAHHGTQCQRGHQGTLFLDEIAEVKPGVQLRLVRYLQEFSVQRVGVASRESLNARIVSATNRSVDQLVQSGILREDLFFRLHVVPIYVPPLRDRKEDVPLLAEAFLAQKCRQTGRRLRFSPECMEAFHDYSWPGNIRQLENLIERMAVMSRHEIIDAGCLRTECNSITLSKAHQQSQNGSSVPYFPEPEVLGDRVLTRMEAAERHLITDALAKCGGNVAAAAHFLGLGQATVYRKIRTLKIPKVRSR